MKNDTSIRHNNQKGTPFFVLALSLTLFSCIHPQMLDKISGISTIYVSVLALSTFVTALFYVKNFKKFKFAHLLTAYFIALLIPTLIYNLSPANLIFFTKTYISIWTISALVEYSIITNRAKTMLKTIGCLNLILVALNIFFILTKGPNSLDLRSAFLGYDNTVLPFIFFGAMIAYVSPMLIEKHESKFLKQISIANIVAILANCYIVESSNAKIAAVMLILLLILERLRLLEKKPVAKIFNLKTFTYFSIIAFFAIVVFRMQYLFEDIIVNYLNRNLTITGRTGIWDSVMMSIRQHPLLGIGAEDFSLRLHSEESIFHAHSTYLNIAYECGIIGLLFYLNIFRVLWKRINEYRNKKQIAILSFIVLIYFIITIIEYYKNTHTFFALLTILYYTPNLIEQKTCRDKKK